MKKCNKCGEVKPKTEFYKNKKTKDGLQYTCKKCCRELNKEYYKNNYEKARENRRIWRENNPEYNKEWAKNNPEKVREYQRKYYKNNPEKVKKRTRTYNKEYWAKRRAIPQNKVNASFRERIRKSINNKKAGRKWESLVGYTLEELMKHLESKFEPWMTWDNYGEWHIDHIRPISLFNFTSAEDKEFRECWALKNLQPLEARENIIKSNKL